MPKRRRPAHFFFRFRQLGRSKCGRAGHADSTIATHSLIVSSAALSSAPKQSHAATPQLEDHAQAPQSPAHSSVGCTRAPPYDTLTPMRAFMHAANKPVQVGCRASKPSAEQHCLNHSNRAALPTCVYSSSRGTCSGPSTPNSRFCELHTCPTAGCRYPKPSAAQYARSAQPSVNTGSAHRCSNQVLFSTRRAARGRCRCPKPGLQV